MQGHDFYISHLFPSGMCPKVQVRPVNCVPMHLLIYLFICLELFWIKHQCSTWEARFAGVMIICLVPLSCCHVSFHYFKKRLANSFLVENSFRITEKEKERSGYLSIATKCAVLLQSLHRLFLDVSDGAITKLRKERLKNRVPTHLHNSFASTDLQPDPISVRYHRYPTQKDSTQYPNHSTVG